MYSCSAMVHLKVTPESALADEPVKIKAWGLPSRQIVTIRAWLKDDRGEMFYSRAFYESNDEGEVDLQQSPATGGDFHGVHPMGLFWALKPVTPHFRLLKRDVMGSPFEVHLELYCHLELNAMPECSPEATASLRRWYVDPGVQRLQVQEGRLRGSLFIPPGEGPFRGVIDLYGGFGGLIEFRSSLLASRGFATLALAYFAYEDLPKSFDFLDLKYFEEAAQFLSNHPKVYGSGVGVIGVSKGAEMALAMASYLPQIAAAVCINGPVTITGSTVSYGDLILPEIPYQRERMMFTQSGGSIMFRLYVDLTDPEHQACMLPVEKAKGPILFLVGENDQSCDSLSYARASSARAKEYGKMDVYIESYPGAGHLLEPPCSPFCPLSRSPSSPIPMIWGGELVAHCRAQEISWPNILDFLRKNIPCSKKNKL
ncbi:PREDICTED: acyl-coenzyme A amino acid N-acyltransferase 1-like [Nanorana parkeri]|uniref:acyl-coenzyme A amino acid N-acyltransferase 1-like n=1 Tax=Nanorana parkeri TaxID=125878 RepID=UPI00085494DB|nr:PREDICTED: acyl-coenzyme A amino acid N-acyltransferase 1-like [Nanorana parkeri]